MFVKFLSSTPSVTLLSSLFDLGFFLNVIIIYYLCLFRGFSECYYKVQYL